jgi:hypothetical protein
MRLFLIRLDMLIFVINKYGLSVCVALIQNENVRERTGRSRISEANEHNIRLDLGVLN